MRRHASHFQESCLQRAAAHAQQPAQLQHADGLVGRRQQMVAATVDDVVIREARDVLPAPRRLRVDQETEQVLEHVVAQGIARLVVAQRQGILFAPRTQSPIPWDARRSANRLISSRCWSRHGKLREPPR